MIKLLNSFLRSYLKNYDIDFVEVKLLIITGSVALEIIDLDTLGLLAAVVGQQVGVVLVHAEVHNVSSKEEKEKILLSYFGTLLRIEFFSP